MSDIRICDLHCHILYGVDDGAKSEEQSNKMLDIAYEEGVRKIILTPHYNRRIWNVNDAVIRERYHSLVSQTKQRHPDLDLYLGRELYYCSDSMEELQTGNVTTMAGSSYVLVEFDTSIRLGDLTQAVMEVVQYGYIPILAHVERYECILDDFSRIYQLKELGAYIQVNASGVMGEYGRLEKKCVKKLLKNGLVDFVATDAHRDNKRTPHIKKCVQYIEKKYGLEYARRIFEYNPTWVIENKSLEG